MLQHETTTEHIFLSWWQQYFAIQPKKILSGKTAGLTAVFRFQLLPELQWSLWYLFLVLIHADTVSYTAYPQKNINYRWRLSDINLQDGPKLKTAVNSGLFFIVVRHRSNPINLKMLCDHIYLVLSHSNQVLA